MAAGSGIADVPCSASQSGDPNASYDPACYSDISLIGIGTYQQALSDSAVCSYAGEFFSNAGTNVQFQGAYPNLNGIVTLTANPDGTFTASMSKNDYINFSAFAQEYFQSECGCPDYGGVIDDINTAVINTTVTITLVTKIAMNNMLTWMNKTSPEARNTPIKDQPPNSVKVFDKTRANSTGKTVRVYGPDGRAVRDIDYGNQAHTIDPEVHDWTWDSNGNGKRSDLGHVPKPGEVPPGY